MNQAAIKNGMKVDPIDPASIAPFMTATEKTALSQQQAAVGLARTELQAAQKGEQEMSMEGVLRDSPYAAIARSLGADINTSQQDAIADTQAKWDTEKKLLSEMPGASFYGERSVTKPKEPATGGQTAGGGAAPEGTKATNAQGQTVVKRGGKWVLE